MSPTLRPVYFACTDTGLQRDHNEDAMHAGALRVTDAGTPWYVFAVADGVGGHEHGEWASQTAISVLVRELQRQLECVGPLEALQAAFHAANRSVWEDGAPGGSSLRAASTLVAVVLRQDTVWWANVGDSRAYVVRQGNALRLTDDHSWVDEQVRAGFMTHADAMISERRHVITRSIGYSAEVQVDSGGPMRLRGDDIVIVCSDGLHGPVSDPELALVVQHWPPEAAAERLIALSNERGGSDNISVIVCAMLEGKAGATLA